MHADRGLVEETRHALSGVGEAVIDLLRGVPGLRALIGDAPSNEPGE